MSGNETAGSDLQIKNVPLFSIVIPVYNVEQYLETCIKSILVQEFQNFEIILIDDGSVDHSSAICDNYAGKDRRVFVLHKENGGLSDARNKGTDLARGEYVIYVDADDFISDRRFLKEAAKLLKSTEHTIDLIVFGYSKYYGKDDWKRIRLPVKEHWMKGSAADICGRGCFRLSAWGKIVRRKLLEDHHLLFRQGVLSEDMEWCANLILAADSVIAWNVTPYAYRQRKGSISDSVSVRHLMDLEANMYRCICAEQRCEKSKLHAFRTYMSENISMYMIVLSRMDKSLWNEKKNRISSWAGYLPYGRNRERILYICIRMLGAVTTLSLLRICSRILAILNNSI